MPSPANTRPKSAISLHPLTPEQALLAALRVDPADLNALEEKEKKAKARKKQASQSMVARPIEYLRAFQARKGMYVQPVTVHTVEAFLSGFEVACHALGFPIDRELWWAAQEARGWKRRSVGAVPQMEAKGLTEEEIVNELIEITIATLIARESGGQ
jgi:hypothetical protein